MKTLTVKPRVPRPEAVARMMLASIRAAARGSQRAGKTCAAGDCVEIHGGRVAATMGGD